MEEVLNASFFAEWEASTPKEQNIKYYPDDSKASIWMYAMITVGTAFVLFVLVTLYLMCHSAIRQLAEQDMISQPTLSRNTGYKSYRSSY